MAASAIQTRRRWAARRRTGADPGVRCAAVLSLLVLLLALLRDAGSWPIALAMLGATMSAILLLYLFPARYQRVLVAALLTSAAGVLAWQASVGHVTASGPGLSGKTAFVAVVLAVGLVLAGLVAIPAHLRPGSGRLLAGAATGSRAAPAERPRKRRPARSGQRLERQIEERTSELTEANQTLRRQLVDRAHLASIVDSCSDAIFGEDPQGCITSWNRAAEQLFGYSRGEVLGRRADLLAPEQGHQELRWIRACARRGHALRGYETLRRHKDGRLIPVRLTVSPLVDSTGEVLGASSLAQDIRRQKLADHQRRRYIAALARSNEELQLFAHIVSHDLSEPLRMIASFGQLLERREGARLSDSSRGYLYHITDAAQRMKGMLDGLLRYARVDVDGEAFRQTNMDEVLDGVLRALRVLIEEQGATIHRSPLPEVWADPAQLGQLLQNLLGNALKFRGEGPPEIRIEATMRDQRWVFAIQDNGPGIPQHHHARLFQPFQRLGQQQVPGMGMGLAVCKKIVQRHGGELSVRSRRGAGTTFYFTLPTNPAPKRSADGRRALSFAEAMPDPGDAAAEYRYRRHPRS